MPADSTTAPEQTARARPARPVHRYVYATTAAAVVAIVFPYLPFVSFSLVGRANEAGLFALIAISLVILIGWVGQVSLGQAAFVGVGAYSTGIANEAWGLGFPANLVVGAAAGAGIAGLLGIVALRVRGLYLAVATLLFSWTADAYLFQQDWLISHSFVSVDPIGEPGAVPFLDFTDRRTFYYAVWATVALVIFAMANLRDRRIGRAFFAVRGSEMAAASLGIDLVRTKLLAFALSGAIAGLAGSLTMINAQGVTSDQFSITRSLFFLAIAVVGGLTSLGGAVASGFLFGFIEEIFFRNPGIAAYLELVSAVLLAVVLLAYPGGLAALGRSLARRAIAAADSMRPSALAGIGAPTTSEPTPVAAASDADRTQEIEVPEGESFDEPARARDDAEVRRRRNSVPSGPLRRLSMPIARLLDRVKASRDARRRVDEATTFLDLSRRIASDPTAAEQDDRDDEPEPPQEPAMHWESLEFPPGPPVEERHLRTVMVEAAGITVRFGGLTAVDDMTIQVRQGEIVGLIGPNGAGKTTMFNAIAGFNSPASGSVRIHGVDVTGFPVHLRSRLGVARTFQVIQLFPQLTVFENLLVATYQTDRTGLVGCMLATGRSLAEEYAARGRVADVVDILGLEDVADRDVSELPFGVLRMVEVARAVVSGAPVIMLDEPASGLDDSETARLSQLIRYIRSLGVTVLLIEHDVAMVTGISDYMYVIDRGKPLAEGTPDQIRRDPTVITAYLGGEDAAEIDDGGDGRSAEPNGCAAPDAGAGRDGPVRVRGET